MSCNNTSNFLDLISDKKLDIPYTYVVRTIDHYKRLYPGIEFITYNDEPHSRKVFMVRYKDYEIKHQYPLCSHHTDMSALILETLMEKLFIEMYVFKREVITEKYNIRTMDYIIKWFKENN